MHLEGLEVCVCMLVEVYWSVCVCVYLYLHTEGTVR